MNSTFLDYLSRFVSARKRAVFDKILETRTRHLTVVLEDIHHSHNASACLRNCDCFGVQDVHIVENRNDYRVNRDVALGAAQWLTLIKHNSQKDNTSACLATLKEQGYRIIATSPHEEGWRLEDYDMRQKTALLFGNERDGLSEAALAQTDGRLHIPMYGFTGSFNISVAVALCLHHLTMKLHNSDCDWQLNEAEKREIKAAWIKTAVRKRLRQLEAEFRRRHAEPNT